MRFICASHQKLLLPSFYCFGWDQSVVNDWAFIAKIDCKKSIFDGIFSSMKQAFFFARYRGDREREEVNEESQPINSECIILFFQDVEIR